MTFSELPVCSPLMHAVLKTLEQWRDILQGKLELFSGPPEDFIANLHIDVIPGKPHSKFKALLSPSNSPFMWVLLSSYWCCTDSLIAWHFIHCLLLKWTNICVWYLFCSTNQQTAVKKKGFNTRHVNIYKTMFLHWLLFPWFSRDAHSTLPIKRLWFHLIKQEPLKEVFIRYIFRKKVNQSEVSAHSTNQQERNFFWNENRFFY